MMPTRSERRSWHQTGRVAATATVVAVAVLAMGPTRAQVTWDSSFSTSGPQDGAGTWSTSASGTNWWNGTANLAWPNTSSSIAVFGASGTAGMVTVSGSVTAGGITFAPIASWATARYAISGGTIGLGASPTILINGSASAWNAGPGINSAIVASNLTITATGPYTPGGSYTGVTFGLGGTNTLSGTTTVNGATYFVAGASQLGTAALRIMDGVTFDPNSPTIPNNLLISGLGISNARGAIRIVNTARTFSGTITLEANANIFGNSGIDATFQRGFAETGGGAKSLRFENSGTNFLTGNSTYTGTTTVSTGVVVLDGGMNTLSPASVLSLTGGRVVLGGTVNGAANQTLSGLTTNAAAAAIGGGAATISELSASISSGTNTFAGILGGTAANANNLALRKSGAGTLSLTGTQNTYAGATTIAGGTLALGVNATIVNSPVITVGNAGSAGAVLDLTAKTGTFVFGPGQTVRGIGTINFGAGKTVAAQGVWAPGNSIGSNAVTGNLALSGTSQFELGTPGVSTSAPGASDFTAVSGTLTLGGALVLANNANADGLGSYGAGSYRLFTASAVSGTFASVSAPAGFSSTRVGMVYTAGTATGQGVFANVYDLASANSISGTINVGTVLTNAALSQALTISNTAPAGSYSEKLDATFATPTGDATAAGAISLLAAGGTNASGMTVGLSTLTAGSKAGSVQVNFVSNGDTSGLGTVSLAPQTVSLVGTVLDPATALLVGGSSAGTNWTVDLGQFLQASGSSSPVAFGISNLAQTAGYTADLSLTSLAVPTDSGAIVTDLSGTSSFATLQAGGTNSFTAWMALGTTGTFTNVYNLAFNSVNNGAGLGGTPQNVTLTVTGVIIVPEPGTLALAGLGIGIAAWLARRK